MQATASAGDTVFFLYLSSQFIVQTARSERRSTDSTSKGRAIDSCVHAPRKVQTPRSNPEFSARARARPLADISCRYGRSAFVRPKVAVRAAFAAMFGTQ